MGRLGAGAHRGAGNRSLKRHVRVSDRWPRVLCTPRLLLREGLAFLELDHSCPIARLCLGASEVVVVPAGRLDPDRAGHLHLALILLGRLAKGGGHRRLLLDRGHPAAVFWRRLLLFCALFAAFSPAAFSTFQDISS